LTSQTFKTLLGVSRKPQNTFFRFEVFCNSVEKQIRVGPSMGDCVPTATQELVIETKLRAIESGTTPISGSIIRISACAGEINLILFVIFDRDFALLLPVPVHDYRLSNEGIALGVVL
jgi:hypothetical protein